MWASNNYGYSSSTFLATKITKTNRKLEEKLTKRRILVFLETEILREPLRPKALLGADYMIRDLIGSFSLRLPIVIGRLK